MVFHRLKTISSFAGSVAQMIGLVWQAQPVSFLGILFLELIQGTIPLLTAWIMKSLIDLLVASLAQTPPGLPQMVLLLLAGQAVLTVVGGLINAGSSFLNSELSHRVSLRTQTLIYQKINGLMGIGPFEDPRFHDLMQFASQGAQHGPVQAVRVLTTLFRNLVTIVGFVGVLVAFNPLLTGAVILAVVPQLYVQLRLSRQQFDLTLENSPKTRLAGYYASLLSGTYFAKEVRLFQLSDYFLQPFVRLTRELHQRQREHQLRTLRWQTLLDMFSNSVGALTFILVILQAFAGRLTLGAVTLYMNAVGHVQGALLGIIFDLTNLHESVLFYQRFTALMAVPQPIALAEQPCPVPPLTRGIEFRNVSFRYSEQHPWVLRNLTMTIPAGQCVALVGLNGAGKTTLVKLLTRLYDPTEGMILWDGIDIRSFDVAALRRQIGTIFQDFVRYELSAYENIGMGSVSDIADRERVYASARQADIHATIEQLPNGYETSLSRLLSIDSPGVELSGGQWQKMALARMFMRQATVLILDEPTAALDAQAEYHLFRQFAELVQGHTSLLISHRFSTVRIADLIAVLEGGQVTEYGTHDELMAHAGSYARLYTMQAEQYLLTTSSVDHA